MNIILLILQFTLCLANRDLKPYEIMLLVELFRTDPIETKALYLNSVTVPSDYDYPRDRWPDSDPSNEEITKFMRYAAAVFTKPGALQGANWKSDLGDSALIRRGQADYQKCLNRLLNKHTSFISRAEFVTNNRYENDVRYNTLIKSISDLSARSDNIGIIKESLEAIYKERGTKIIQFMVTDFGDRELYRIEIDENDPEIKHVVRIEESEREKIRINVSYFMDEYANSGEFDSEKYKADLISNEFKLQYTVTRPSTEVKTVDLNGLQLESSGRAGVDHVSLFTKVAGLLLECDQNR